MLVDSGCGVELAANKNVRTSRAAPAVGLTVLLTERAMSVSWRAMRWVLDASSKRKSRSSRLIDCTTSFVRSLICWGQTQRA